MKEKLSKTLQRLMLATISVLGFSITSCEPYDMYGSPTSDYHAEDLTIMEEEESVAAPAEEIAVEEE